MMAPPHTEHRGANFLRWKGSKEAVKPQSGRGLTVEPRERGTCEGTQRPELRSGILGKRGMLMKMRHGREWETAEVRDY